MSALVGALLVAQLASAAQPERHWEGELRFRGDVWPVRVAIEAVEPARVTVDLPDMVMAWEPVPATLSADSLSLQLPFGLGEFTLDPGEDSVATARVIGSDTMWLRLRRAAAPPYTRRPHRFTVGAATLVGELVLPAGRGPHPAVVLVHGSSPQGRESWGYRSYADLLARQGLAVLYYDKRGVGESTGPWMDRSFADIGELAGDAAAAVESLRTLDEIDGDRIGLTGGSQAGWVSLLASRRTPIAFLVLRAAPAVTPAEQERQSVEARLRAAGLPQPALDSALAHTRLYFDVVRGEAELRTLLRSSERAAASAWGEYVPLAQTDDDLFWWRRNHDVDPAPLLASLDVPALFVYGGNDRVVPAQPNVERLLRHTAGRDVTVLIVPGADHALELPGGRDADGRWRFPRRSPLALEVMLDWLRRRVVEDG